MFVHFLNKPSNLFAAEVESAWGKDGGNGFFLGRLESIGEGGGEVESATSIDRGCGSPLCFALAVSRAVTTTAVVSAPI